MEGWIKLHRKTIEHWIFTNPNYFRAWVIMLFTVNYEPKKILINGLLIDCDRGQSLLSLESWVDLFGVSKKNGSWTFQKVRTFFDLLEQDGMITKENMIKTTRITICNYATYQDIQQPNNNQVTTKQQLDNNQITTTKESKEIKKDKNIKNKEYSYDAFLLNEFCKPYFDEKYLNENTLDCFDKLLTIDKYTIAQIQKAITLAKHDFWSKNFLSPLKLRTKDKTQITYIDKFLNLQKHGNKIDSADSKSPIAAGEKSFEWGNWKPGQKPTV